MKKKQPLNQILYGPPGTGKTYRSIALALAIVTDTDPEDVLRQMGEDLHAVMEKFRTFLRSGKIAFTTFHQSMGYEEFIEGIKPETDENGGIRYVVRDGIFKAFCDRARVLRSNLTDGGYFFGGSPTVWKVSLMGSGKNPVRQECMDNEHIRIGWDEYGETVTDETEYCHGGKAILDAFINTMKTGDIIFSCFSATTIDAIGVVTGDCEWHDEYGRFKRLRKVKWIVKDINENIVEINGGKQLTQSTVYKLNIAIEDVVDIIKSHTGENTEAHYEYPGKYVFIIDEINRGNVSKIFGELITLIEDEKRLGNEEEAKCILPYSGEWFGVPKNVYLIGTMNTADRSLVQLDAALRRRFSFVELMPTAEVLPVRHVCGVDVVRMLERINERITALLDREHQIGHSYFMGLTETSSLSDLAAIFREKILPLLQEYFYDDYAAIRDVLSDAFVEEIVLSLRSGEKTIYRLKIPQTAEGYVSIYE